jgi:hypothetical protein
MAASMESELSSPASARVQREWLRRVEAEYRSAAITQHLTLWLIQLAAPPELISDGLSIVADELRHARLSFDVFTAAGGQGGPTLTQESLSLERAHPLLEDDLFVNNLRSFVLGETVAVRLFKSLRERCDVTVARQALDEILVDEVGHRDFGWTVLEWMLASPDRDRYVALTNRHLPTAIADLRRIYGSKDPSDASPVDDMSSEDRSWGLMPLSEYRQAVELCLDKDYRPRFSGLGIECSSWAIDSHPRGRAGK